MDGPLRTSELLNQSCPETGVVTIGTPIQASIYGELLRQNNAGIPPLPILIFAEDAEERYGISYLRAGAHGCLKKTATSEEIVIAVKTLLSGGNISVNILSIT
ncbi:MAG TPA: hypothetical protein VFA74_02880 [Terriglobales bacterium]|nr:hypothetical protein [Terriglobales bacterium]